MENKSFVFAHIIIHFPLYLSAGRRKVQVVLGCLVDQFSLMPTANWKVSKTFFSALYALLLKIFLKLSFAARSVTRLASQWGEFQSQNEKVCSVFFFPLLLQRRTWIYIKWRMNKDYTWNENVQCLQIKMECISSWPLFSTMTKPSLW